MWTFHTLEDFTRVAVSKFFTLDTSTDPVTPFYTLEDLTDIHVSMSYPVETSIRVEVSMFYLLIDTTVVPMWKSHTLDILY